MRSGHTHAFNGVPNKQQTTTQHNNKQKNNKQKNNKQKTTNKTKQNKTKQNKTNKTKQNKTKQNKTKQNKTKQNKTKQNKKKTKKKNNKQQQASDSNTCFLVCVTVMIQNPADGSCAERALGPGSARRRRERRLRSMLRHERMSVAMALAAATSPRRSTR